MIELSVFNLRQFTDQIGVNRVDKSVEEVSVREDHCTAPDGDKQRQNGVVQPDRQHNCQQRWNETEPAQRQDYGLSSAKTAIGIDDNFGRGNIDFSSFDRLGRQLQHPLRKAGRAVSRPLSISLIP